MKKVLCVGITILFLIGLPNLVTAEQWDEFSKFYDQFYHLDKQNFNNISCKVVASTLNKSLEQMKAQLKPLENKIQIIENISDFKMNFSRELGLTFDLPSFDVKVISEDGITDRTKLELGIKLIKDGIQVQLVGITDMLKGLFDGYLSPKKDNYIIHKITNKKNNIEMVYEKNKCMITDVYSNARLKSKQICSDMEILADQFYQKFNNKLLIKNASLNLSQAGNKVNTDVVVNHQEIKSIVLPSKIVTQIKMFMQDAQVKTQIEIILENCEVN